MPFIFDINIFVFVLLAAIILAIVWIIRLEIKVHKLLRGSDNKSLEGTIRNLQKRDKEFTQFKQEVEVYLKNVEARLRHSISGVNTIRFNPFKGTGEGGNQSFATAFLNENGEGVIISTVHTRDRVGVFSKPVKNGTSEYELTDEERSAIQEAYKDSRKLSGNKR